MAGHLHYDPKGELHYHVNQSKVILPAKKLFSPFYFAHPTLINIFIRCGFKHHSKCIIEGLSHPLRKITALSKEFTSASLLNISITCVFMY